jgi:hypothetical protein
MQAELSGRPALRVRAYWTAREQFKPLKISIKIRVVEAVRWSRSARWAESTEGNREYGGEPGQTPRFPILLRVVFMVAAHGWTTQGILGMTVNWRQYAPFPLFRFRILNLPHSTNRECHTPSGFHRQDKR